MKRSILVAFATKKGSTREVAEVIAERLEQHGLETTLLPAAEVDELGDYGGVVLGGSLYMGRWHPDARHLLKEHRDVLATIPIAIFAMGPLTMEQHDIDGARKQLDHALAKTPEIEPVSVAIFGGVVDPAKLRFPFSHMPATDARDWDAISAWADQVAEKIGVGLVAINA